MQRCAALTLLVAACLAAEKPDFHYFAARVQPIFIKSRSGGGRCVDCHSLESNKAAFHLEPLPSSGAWTEGQSRRNFENASKLIAPGEPLKSRLLTHPLAEEAGGDPFHTGGKFWTSRDDPEWQTLAEWVRRRRLEVSRRLIIRPGAIGDFIVSLPAIESLGPEEVWTTSAHVPLVRFARARAIASTGLDLLGITEPDPRLLETLRGFDEIVSWYGSNRPDFRELVESLELPFHFLNALPPIDGTESAVDFYVEQTAALRANSPEPFPRIPVPSVPRAGAIVHPFSGSPRKNWPLDRYREVALELQAEWCAGPEDDLPGAIRIPDLYALACRLAGAQVFIGNDSGIAHLAAAVGTPVVVLFGPTDPRIWAPRGENVRVLTRTEMAAIPTADVLAAARALIK